MGRAKFITAAQAAELVKDGDTVGVVGFRIQGCPEELIYALQQRYLKTGSPKGITTTHGASPSPGLGFDPEHPQGMNLLGAPGMEGCIIRDIGAHMGLNPLINAWITDNKIEGYCIPEGVMMHLYRAKAGNKPCVVTHVGLGTFADPRETGCQLNAKSTRKIVDLVEINGKEYLQYYTFPINVQFIRGTTADENGNISMEREGNILEHKVMAGACKASGGIVIAQVERVIKAGTMDPKSVVVPGIMVDYVVKCSDPQKWHRQCADDYYNPSLSGEMQFPMDSVPVAPLDERKVMCRRAAFEMAPNVVGNLGMGVPETLGAVCAEENIADLMTLTVEPGPIGGVPGKVEAFGCAYNAEAYLDQPDMFDFYDGGGLDLAVLGLAEMDQYGNINVSKFGRDIAGAGGFINITTSAKTVVFCGAMMAKGLRVKIEDGKVVITQEGKVKKFVKNVAHKTFSGDYAKKTGQKILYVTERAVFEMREDGLTLTEVAPGIDYKTQVLPNIDFECKVAPDLKEMDARIFQEGPMGIRDEILAKG